MSSVLHHASKRGNMAILVMIIAGFTGMVMLALAAVSAMTVQSHKVAHHLQTDVAATSVQQLLADDIITWLDRGTASTADLNAVRVRNERLAELAEWGSGLTLESVTRANPTSPLFAKGVLLSSQPGGNPLHPLEGMSGVVSTIGVDATLSGNYVGTVSLSSSVRLRETPACDIGFISVGLFEPAPDAIPIAVTGTAYFPQGASASATPGKLTADRLVSPVLPAALNGISARRNVNPLFRGSWGVAIPSALASPSNLAGTPAPQSYFNTADRVYGVQDSGLIGAEIPGVAYRPFPAGGPRRLVITLAELPPGTQRIYVNCESPLARTNGIVVIGDPNGGPGVTRTIATNGRVWLWGDNLQPVGIASTGGEWRLTDDSWTEADAGGLPPLALVWTGHLFSPTGTSFTTPQTGPGSHLELHGSLTAGACSGDIESMTIFQQAGSPLRQLVERVAYLYYLD